jgi:hypothetical protein
MTRLCAFFLTFSAVFICFCTGSVSEFDLAVSAESAASSESDLPLQMINYIEPHQLAEMIQNGSKNFLIVDVRENDYDVSSFANLSIYFSFFYVDCKGL